MYNTSLLPPETIQLIRQEAPNAEADGKLTNIQLELIWDQKWFHLFVPEEYGGLSMSLPQAVQLEESLAFADGSLGWVVTLCAGAAMFVGYFSEALAKEIFNDPERVCIAGSEQATGTADYVNGGFEITGSWPYASGAPHATHFTANCIVAGGAIQSFIFTREEVLLQPNWTYLGLQATAGYSYSVTKLWVPLHRTFGIDPGKATLPHPVYRYPFLQLAEATIAANVYGMCAAFVSLAYELLTGRTVGNERAESVRTQGLHLATASIDKLSSLKHDFYAALNGSWELHLADALKPESLEEVTIASLQMAVQSRLIVNDLYPYCGLHAARTDTEINRVWRNINTASQHSLMVPAK